MLTSANYVPSIICKREAHNTLLGIGKGKKKDIIWIGKVKRRIGWLNKETMEWLDKNVDLTEYTVKLTENKMGWLSLIKISWLPWTKIDW